jgi:hypothetical protein
MSHLRSKHGTSAKEFQVRYPDYPLVSTQTKKLASITCKDVGCGTQNKGLKRSKEALQKLAQVNPSSIQVGAKFENAEVVELLGREIISGRLRQKVSCRCHCGTLYETLDIYLWRGEGARCRACYLGDRRVLVGSRFDKLVVIEYRQVNGRSMAVCQCDCGSRVVVRSSSLAKNKTNNCGCAPRGKWKGCGEVSQSYFNRVLRGAKVRGLSVTVDLKELWDLYLKQKGRCALSGEILKLSQSPSKAVMTASLDRIDSSRGYEIGNIQWVHKDVNLMKNEIDQTRFIELCHKVSKLRDPT